jgi:hypothetical protein
MEVMAKESSGDKRLNPSAANTAYAHDGKVMLSLWFDDRKSGDDPLRVLLKPGEALEMIAALARAAHAALQNQPGDRIL